ncbi:MAG: hypothetical protein Q4A28_05345 [Brachymonas sp.]|nr:hypothetical protein [Brachymonas sp.]
MSPTHPFSVSSASAAATRRASCLRRVRAGLGAALLATTSALWLGACSKGPQTHDATQQQAAAQQQGQPTADAVPAPVAQASAQANGMAAAPAPAPGRIVAVDAQAVSPLGLTVRVKQVELAADVTVLSVSLSLGGDKTIFTSLSAGETYLRDEAGNKIMIKAPADNPHLRVRKGETLEGQLVFMGALPANTRQVEWVINEGHAPDDDSGPGLKLDLPLGAG